MPRIDLPASIQEAPAAAQPLLQGVEKMLGSVPNLFRLTANSPASLEGYLGLNGALASGKLSLATRESIALAVAELNGCDYCLAAHSYVGKNLAKLDDAEISANRHGRSNNPQVHAAVRFAVKLVQNRGSVSEADVDAVKAAGFSQGEIVEIVANVALSILTNYLNNAFDTPIDFPAVQSSAA